MTLTADYAGLAARLAWDGDDTHDHTLRGAAADLADELADAGVTTKDVACPACGGRKKAERDIGGPPRHPHKRYVVEPPRTVLIDCPICSGSGNRTVPHDYRAEAFGHRLRLSCNRLRAGVECGRCNSNRIPGNRAVNCVCSGTGRLCGPEHDPDGWREHDAMLAEYAGEDGPVARRLTLRRAAAELKGPWRSDCVEGRKGNERRRAEVQVRYDAALARVRADVFAGVDLTGINTAIDTIGEWIDLRDIPDSWFRHGILWEIRLPWEVWARVGEHLYGREALVGGVTLTTWPEEWYEEGGRYEVNRRWQEKYPGLKLRLLEDRR